MQYLGVSGGKYKLDFCNGFHCMLVGVGVVPKRGLTAVSGFNIITLFYPESFNSIFIVSYFIFFS